MKIYNTPKLELTVIDVKDLLTASGDNILSPSSSGEGFGDNYENL